MNREKSNLKSYDFSANMVLAGEADGSLTPESTGSRYTELITHSLLNSSGGGFGDRTLLTTKISARYRQ
jgi:hypothetical protein